MDGLDREHRARMTSGPNTLGGPDRKLFLGFDPGGGDGFGVAVLDGNAPRAATVSSVAEAVQWAVEQCGDQMPVAAGIDSLLHWSDGRAGWRPADKKLREAYPAVRSSVVSPNGLYGSMAIGGMALALRLRHRCPGILLNETHPKVLMHARGAAPYTDDAPSEAIKWFAKQAGLALPGGATGHELDALVSAWATREGLAQDWPDLVTDDPSLVFPAGPVSYLWPELPASKARPDPDIGVPLTAMKATQRPTRQPGQTVNVGYENRNRQVVVRCTALPGDDQGHSVYVLRCGVCGHEYGAHGFDIFQRRCPKHDGGAPGLRFE
jgi:hypothetical protein